MAQDQVAPIYEEIYQDMVKLMNVNTEHGDKLEKILTYLQVLPTWQRDHRHWQRDLPQPVRSFLQSRIL